MGIPEPVEDKSEDGRVFLGWKARRLRWKHINIWQWVKTNGIPFWGGMFTGATIWILTHGLVVVSTAQREQYWWYLRGFDPHL